MTDAGPGPEVGVVISAGGPFRPVVAVTRGAAVDEAGIDREKVLGIEAETTTAIGQQVGDEHIGLPDQVEQHRPGPPQPRRRRRCTACPGS